MTPQEIFDYIVNHLRQQGVKSREPSEDGVRGRCAYRGENGTMCAAGCLIPDDKYNPNMEGMNALHRSVWSAIQVKVGTPAFVGEAGVGEPDADATVEGELVRAMQYAHDAFEPYEWEAAFERTAIRFELAFA